jgi:hypothetical protein
MAKKLVSKSTSLRRSKFPSNEKIQYKILNAYHSFVVDETIEDGGELNIEDMQASKEENGINHHAVAVVFTNPKFIE